MKTRVHGLTAFTLAAGCLHGACAATVAGPPTFEADAALDAVRADTFGPFIAVASQQGYKSQGVATAGVTAGPANWFSGPPSVASATADEFHLRATSRSQGAVFSAPAFTPQVTAVATAQTTRFFSFASDWTIDDIPVLLDGVLGGYLAYAEIPAANFASMRYALTLTDVAGQSLGTVFEVSARVNYVGANTLLTTRSTGGYADPALWQAAFTPTTLPGTGFGVLMAWDVGYIDQVDTPFVAQAGSTYGFRWTLHTETSLAGQSVGGQFTADFGHTADIGLGRTDAELAALGITEVLTAPVPEPQAWALWLAGMVSLATLLRRRLAAESSLGLPLRARRLSTTPQSLRDGIRVREHR